MPDPSTDPVRDDAQFEVDIVSDRDPLRIIRHSYTSTTTSKGRIRVVRDDMTEAQRLAEIRSDVLTGRRSDVLRRSVFGEEPFSEQRRAIITRGTGLGLRRYAVRLLLGAKTQHVVHRFTFTGARRTQRRLLDAAHARDAKLNAEAIQAAHRAGRI